MPVLVDAGWIPLSSKGMKRQRLEPLQKPATFQLIVSICGPPPVYISSHSRSRGRSAVGVSSANLPDLFPLQGRSLGSLNNTRLHGMREITVAAAVQVERAGIIGIVGDVSSTHQRADPPQVEDPRHAKQQMAADLCTTAAQEEFASSLAEALADEHLLRTCLLPIAVTEQVTLCSPAAQFSSMLLVSDIVLVCCS